jgi:hypothetical protein
MALFITTASTLYINTALESIEVLSGALYELSFEFVQMLALHESLLVTYKRAAPDLKTL